MGERLTPSGRFPSKGPNMQNIPIRTEEGRLIREAFTRNLENENGKPGQPDPEA